MSPSALSGLTHIAARIRASFLVKTGQYPLTLMYQISFTHSALSGHWSYIHLVVIVNNLAVGIHVQAICLSPCFQIFWAHEWGKSRFTVWVCKAQSLFLCYCIIYLYYYYIVYLYYNCKPTLSPLCMWYFILVLMLGAQNWLECILVSFYRLSCVVSNPHVGRDRSIWGLSGPFLWFCCVSNTPLTNKVYLFF